MRLEAYVLTLQEKEEVRAALDNQILLGALRKIMGADVEFWASSLKGEALSPDPRACVMSQYAARQMGSERFETVIRKAVGL